MPILLLLIPVLFTLAGGALAIRFRRSLPVLIALAIGLLLGAAFLDLLPEAISLGSSAGISTDNVLALTLASFLVFFALRHGLESLAVTWGEHPRHRRTLGKVSGLLLIFHSFRDGMAIGLSYAASPVAGYAVAAGIAAHDLGDGMNTIILTTGGDEPRVSDLLFLAADALAPLLGGLLTAWWAFSPRISVILLAAAAGFFMEMATNDFLPHLRRGEGSARLLLPAVLAGAALIYGANRLLAHMP